MVVRWVRRLLLGIILVAVVIGLCQGVKEAQVRTLNHFMPRDYAPLLLSQQLPRYMRYYRLVSWLTPAKADAQAMLGFCYAAQGQWHKAEIAYQAAVDLKPDLFWSYYNLGYLALRQGLKEKASAWMRQAVGVDSHKALETIVSSKIYGDMATDFGWTPRVLAERLEEGYARAGIWLTSGQFDPAEGPHVF